MHGIGQSQATASNINRAKAGKEKPGQNGLGDSLYPASMNKQTVHTCAKCGSKRFAPQGTEVFLCEVCALILKGKRVGFGKPYAGLKRFSCMGYQSGGITNNRPGPMKVTNKPPDEYKQYLKSPGWHETKKRMFEVYGAVCLACGSRLNLQVHHQSYRFVYSEPLADLKVLCAGCHGELHKQFAVLRENHRKSESKWFGLEKFTRRFIKRAQAKKQ